MTNYWFLVYIFLITNYLLVSCHGLGFLNIYAYALGIFYSLINSLQHKCHAVILIHCIFTFLTILVHYFIQTSEEIIPDTDHIAAQNLVYLSQDVSYTESAELAEDPNVECVTEEVVTDDWVISGGQERYL